MQLAEASKLVEEWSSQPQCFDLWRHAATLMQSIWTPAMRKAGNSFMDKACRATFVHVFPTNTMLSSFESFWIRCLVVFFSGKLKIATASCPVACLHDAPGRALSNLRSSRRNRRRLWDIWTCQQLRGSWLEFHSSQVFHECSCSLFFVTSLY